MESGDSHRFQTFDLNNTPPFADVHHRQGTATSISPCNCRVRSFIKCTTGCSIKRRSPSPSFTLEEPPIKRAALCHPSAATANGYVAAAAAAAVVSDGIKNDADAALVTPEKTSPSGTNLQNVLNRSLSETITCHTRAKEALNSQPVESSNINISVSSPEADTWPPLPPVLYGSSSEPIPSDYLPEADSTTPSKTLLFPSPPGAGADSRRLRRMKERMKQMNQWIQKVTDDDEEDMISQNTIDTNPKKMSEETKLNPEAVVVEENGENLILHFNCPCGKGFEIFLSGRKCYYRLL